MRLEPKAYNPWLQGSAGSDPHAKHLHQQFVRLINLSDLAHQELDEASLESALPQYEQIASATGATFVIIDLASGGYPYLSEAFLERTFLDVHALRKRGLAAWMDSLHPEDARGLAAIHQAIYDMVPDVAQDRRRIKFSYNYRLRDKHGNHRHFLQQSVGAQYSKEGFPRILITYFTEVGHLRPHHSIVATFSARPRERTVWCYDEGKLTLMDQPMLSGRELEILDLVSSYNYSSAEVAERLNLKPTTVAFYRKRLLARTGCISLHGLAAYARLVGWR